MYDIVYVGIYDKRHNTFLPQICLRPSGFAWRLFCISDMVEERSKKLKLRSKFCLKF